MQNTISATIATSSTKNTTNSSYAYISALHGRDSNSVPNNIKFNAANDNDDHANCIKNDINKKKERSHVNKEQGEEDELYKQYHALYYRYTTYQYRLFIGSLLCEKINDLERFFIILNIRC